MSFKKIVSLVYFLFCLFNAGFHSVMIGHNSGYQDKLMDWLAEAGFREKYWVPCYKGPVDGWTTTAFHIRCDSMGPTLTLARKSSYLFGGFNDQSWKSKSPPFVVNITS